ncbi:DUF2326 domain-containing protein [Nitrosomonas supralitoralis]|uniref:DUF2326 domain-containing protein n=1 Tax=Nitrosomonas supralitoralis TaxID=2116706 RepID=A0A2P7NXG8_9PROT|nr:DUF2326 domain-containing protein [Nitrosomonas supralitoralis]PSJ18151.1 hypothetical protein C7H79_04695 [Nitrosomonas supralitoralis]
MKLISLKIKVDTTVSRLVEFHDGLNLVTNNKGVGRSGNSVGKSTLSRVIDFLLLGSINPIYIDEEFQKPNIDIEQLFIKHDVTAELSFIGLDDKAHQLKRNLSVISKEYRYWLDGFEMEQDKFEIQVQSLCFGINTRRPSIRSIVPKFIRNDSHKMLNTTKFLDNRAGMKDYCELFLYLFGFNNSQLLTDKRDASNLVVRRKRNSLSINAMVKEQKPGTEVKKYFSEAKALEAELLKFDYSPEYDNPLERLTELQHKEDAYTADLMSIDRKLSNIERTIRMLSHEDGLYLENEVKAIYEYAGIKLDGAIKEFHEVLKFHQNLINKKKQFLTIDVPNIQEEKLVIQTRLDVVRKDKLRVFSDMRSTESIKNITTKLKKLGELKIQLGKLEGLVEQQEKAAEDLKFSKVELESILSEIAREIQNIYSFENILNKHFKLLTKKILNEEYAFNLNYDESTGDCKLEVKNTVTNPEGGKKKAEVIAFDLAYIYAVNDSKYRRPKFVFHDSIEDIDSNQIEIIFDEATKVPGQQIISLLSDKISTEVYKKYESNIILLLDEDMKFFCI